MRSCEEASTSMVHRGIERRLLKAAACTQARRHLQVPSQACQGFIARLHR